MLKELNKYLNNTFYYELKLYILLKYDSRFNMYIYLEDPTWVIISYEINKDALGEFNKFNMKWSQM